MMKQKLGFLVLGAAALACSGRYYEVGSMDGGNGVAGSSSAGGTAASGGAVAGSGSVSNPAAGASAGAMDAGPAMPADGLCVPAGAPPKLTGPFAEPMVVWRRIAMLTWGPEMPLVTKPPVSATTYAWAGQQVAVELQATKDSSGTAPGVELFLRQALGLDVDAPFEQHWGALLSTRAAVLNALLRAPLGQKGRVGIFTEPSWLALHTGISARGAAIEDVLFGMPVPPPPQGVPMPEPNPGMTDRQSLEASVTRDPACSGCHARMDPSGFALGHFAADGSYRELDHGLPIDTTGSRQTAMFPDEPIQFDGIADFGQKFEGNCEALQGIANSFLRAALVINEAERRDELYDESVARVQRAFVNSDRTYEDLVRAYIQSPAGLMP